MATYDDTVDRSVKWSPCDVHRFGRQEGVTAVDYEVLPLMAVQCKRFDYDSRVQGARDNRAQGTRDSRVQGARDNRAQGTRDSRVQGTRDSRVQGARDSRVQGAREAFAKFKGEKLVVKRKRKESIAERMRRRNILQSYYLFDIWDKGYIEMEEGCQITTKCFDESPQLAESLLQILEAIQDLNSSRGVVEKGVFIAALQRRIDQEISNSFGKAERDGKSKKPSIFAALRCVNNPISDAWKRRLQCTNVGSRPFFTSAYISAGRLENMGVMGQQNRQEIKKKYGGKWGSIYAPLSVHADITRQRKNAKIEMWKKIIEEREKEEIEWKKPIKKSKGVRRNQDDERDEKKLSSLLPLRNFSSQYGQHNTQRKEIAQREIHSEKASDEVEKCVAIGKVILGSDEKKQKLVATETNSDEQLVVPLELGQTKFGRIGMCKGISRNTVKEYYVVHRGDPPDLIDSVEEWAKSLRCPNFSAALKGCEVGCSGCGADQRTGPLSAMSCTCLLDEDRPTKKKFDYLSRDLTCTGTAASKIVEGADCENDEERNIQKYVEDCTQKAKVVCAQKSQKREQATTMSWTPKLAFQKSKSAESHTNNKMKICHKTSDCFRRKKLGESSDNAQLSAMVDGMVRPY